MKWKHANKFGGLQSGGDAMKVEALVAIAEQLEALNKTLSALLEVQRDTQDKASNEALWRITK